ncbi:GNAT family N-acetyltransferase [Paenibacillus piri]|uniref:N-acetyltransferase domain-containing protein n=1 Tax=Paenibacillus piri TaxID=2547395 RepID=A0A4R5KQP4_9BACL|nr:GNAT family N-acetyltransferase [Paenibacillus piri]TDF97060.1 hypothetical protein E1757_14515 [Paenibacillus piri]
MTTHCRSCVSDDDFAKASLFLLAHKRDLHPSYTTLEMVTLIYSYVTQGRLICCIADDDQRIAGVAAYYQGTPEQEFKDRDVASLDAAIMAKAYRGSRLFVQGLQYMLNTIIENHPEVRELKLAALAENDYLCRLYSKFAPPQSVREGTHGKEIVFCEKINTVRDTLKKFTRV